MKNFFLSGLLILCFLVSCNEDQKYNFPPNIFISHAFDSMPSTLFSLVNNNEQAAKVGIYLPENYAYNKKYPLVLFLNGGPGGPGGIIEKQKKITHSKDYICINFPLFISHLDSVNEDSSNYWQRMFIDHKDSTIIWENFQIMLNFVFETIPNIDTENTFMGGFSNGANTTVVLLSRKNLEIKKYFKNFFFIEGGGHLTQPEALADCNFLYMISDMEEREKMHKDYDNIKAEGSNAEKFIMEDTGHAFPEKFHYVLKDWMDKCVKENNTEQQ